MVYLTLLIYDDLMYLHLFRLPIAALHKLSAKISNKNYTAGSARVYGSDPSTSPYEGMEPGNETNLS